MKTITFIRHAKADKSDIYQPDYKREITERGRGDVELMASHWKKENLTMPDLIISSPATRTIQTTELFCSFLNINFEDIMVEASLYEAWINEYQQLIYSIENHIHNIWIVAHNPTIAYAVTYFSAQEIETFPTTAMANVQFESDDWKKVGQESGKCNFILTPKQFKGSED